jgi:hypothetical protein
VEPLAAAGSVVGRRETETPTVVDQRQGALHSATGHTLPASLDQTASHTRR